jgi:histidine triad (HIT) family protein
VFHIHFHVIPRWEGEGLRPHGGGMADGAKLKAQADKIRGALAEG